mgnify:CR=1 FL=1
MIHWRKFDYKSLDDMRSDITELDVHLPVSANLEILAQPIQVHGKTVKNRIAIQPLECFDASLEGTPSDLTFRRYRRLSAGGSGMIWFESVSTTPRSQTSRWQARINEANLPVFQRLLYEIRDSASDGKPPYVIVQITNSGRNSRLDGDGKFSDGIPQNILVENPYLPKPRAVVMTDDELDAAQDEYVKTAMLMKEAGFDAIDIRCCHGYLISETLSAFTRENSKYGGSFENRTRFLLEIIDRVNKEVGIPLGMRYNATDMLPYPYGWGMKTDGSMTPDFTEPLKLAEMLIQRGVTLLNISMGRSHATHIVLPYNRHSVFPKEHQLVAMAFYHNLAAIFKKHFKDTVVMAGAKSWARQYSANRAAGGIESGMYDMAGWGRMALAYPDFANDIVKNGEMVEKKCCITCNSCFNLIGTAASTGSPVGCPIKDKEIYAPIHKKYVGNFVRPHISQQSVKLWGMSENPPAKGDEVPADSPLLNGVKTVHEFLQN